MPGRGGSRARPGRWVVMGYKKMRKMRGRGKGRRGRRRRGRRRRGSWKIIWSLSKSRKINRSNNSREKRRDQEDQRNP